MKEFHNIGILGGSGLVGQELKKLILQRKFPHKELHSFSSKDTPLSFDKYDLIFSSLSSHLSTKYVPMAINAGCQVIDLSSAYRLDGQVPLVIPEINLPNSMPQLVASPNCIATILLMILAPLHRYIPIKKIQMSTYQAASGAGKAGIAELKDNLPPKCFPHPYSANLFLHESPLNEEGYCEEEDKVIYETRKILNAPNLKINVRAVRVPIIRAHSISASVTFEKDLSPEIAKGLLKEAPMVLHHPSPTPLLASEKSEIYYATPRRDRSIDNTLDLWIVGDQLLKGAALNALQIAEAYCANGI